MSTYVLILIFGTSLISIDFNSKTQCEIAGQTYQEQIPKSKYLCLERR